MSEAGQEAAADPLIDTNVGNYKIVRRLGLGGMGAVYEAVHEMMGKRAAVKMLLPELSTNQEIVGRFFNEAKAATRIQHPGIVDIYDFGYHGNGQAYISMQFLQGEALTDALKTGLSFPRALDIAWQLASALGAAHQNGIVHRDVKPDNIFIVPDPATPTGDRVKVLDFGIAKLTGEDGGMSMKTRTGTVMGTPVYMSPEQCRGAGALDHRSDIYAIGCIMFEMVCGQPPFVREGFGELISAHLNDEPPRPSDINSSVPALYESIVMRALQKSPDDRQQAAEEISTELATINPEFLADVTPIPAVGYAGGTGREKMRTGQSAPRGRTRHNPAQTTFQIEGDGSSKRNKLIAAGAAGLVVVGGLIALLSGGAEAPAPEPVAAAAPVTPPEKTAAPKRVDVSIKSTPPRASVIRADDDAFLGRTPYHGNFPTGEGDIAFIVRAQGFEDQKVVLPLRKGGEVDVTLKAVPAPEKVAGANKRRVRKAGKAAAGAAAGKKKGGKKKKEWGELVDF